MTGRQAPRLASWLLHRFAFGLRRESLIGDIHEQYQLGRSPTWYRRQTLAAVVIGSITRVRMYSYRALTSLVRPATLPWLFATAGLSLMCVSSNHGTLPATLNLLVSIYCSVGFGVLLLTIAGSDERVSLTIVTSTPREASAPRVG